MVNPSFTFYQTLLGLCLVNDLSVERVGRSTLHRWKSAGVPQLHCDSLSFKLLWHGVLNSEQYSAIYNNCFFQPDHSPLLSSLVKCRAPGSSVGASFPPSNGRTDEVNT